MNRLFRAAIDHLFARRPAQARPPRQRLRQRLGLEVMEDRTVPASLISHFAGLAYNGTGYVPPDSNGTAGTSSYLETVNQTLRLSTKTGTAIATDTFDHFFFITGGLTRADSNPNSPSRLSDPVVVWDDRVQQFIVGDQDVNASFNRLPGETSSHVSTFDIAVSKSATALSAYQADVFPNQILGTSLPTLRPTVMHDSVAGDPMWLSEEGWLWQYADNHHHPQDDQRSLEFPHLIDHQRDSDRLLTGGEPAPAGRYRGDHRHRLQNPQSGGMGRQARGDADRQQLRRGPGHGSLVRV